VKDMSFPDTEKQPGHRRKLLMVNKELEFHL
jgi:hypothetical protein